MSVSIEQKVEHLKNVIVDCVKEEFKDSLPNATITVYLKSPKYTPRGEAATASFFKVSDDSLSEEALKNKTDSHTEPLRQRILDKMATEYPDSRRYPGNDSQIGYLGQILEISNTGEPLPVDTSDFQKIAEFAVSE